MNECEIFMAALERESVLDRDAFLDEACGGNAQLRQRIESLFDSHGKAESLLEHPAFEVRNTVGLGRSEYSTDGRVTTDEPGPMPSNRSRSISLTRRKFPIRSAAWGPITSPRSSVGAAWASC